MSDFAHIKGLQEKLLQATENIEALESEHDALLLEAEETEQEALHWQQIALQLARRLAKGSDQHAELLAAMEKPLNRATSTPPREDYAAFLEESEMAHAARSLAEEVALCESRLEYQEVEIQRLTEQLFLHQEVSAAEAAQEKWQKSQLQSAKQSIAKHRQAIEHQKFRADKASDRKNALQEDKKRLMKECEVVEAKELAEYQRRCGLETEHQELKREMLGLCEELASANHVAEATLEEQLQRSQNALRDLEASTDHASSRDQQIVGPSEATQSPLTYSSWRPSLPREFQASPPGLQCMSPTFGTPERPTEPSDGGVEKETKRWIDAFLWSVVSCFPKA